MPEISDEGLEETESDDDEEMKTLIVMEKLKRMNLMTLRKLWN